MDEIRRPPYLTAVRGALRSPYYALRFYRERLCLPRRRRCVVIFPSGQKQDPASNLRAWLIAPELEKLGWRAVVVPAPLSLRQRRWLLALEKPDVILLQQTRHLLNQPHLYPYPCVLDQDDADYIDPIHHDRIVQCAEDAAAVIGGNRFVAYDCLGRHNPNAHVIWTCTPPRTRAPAIAPADRPPIVAWAHASPLGYKLEAEFVQAIMVELAKRARCIYWLFGTVEHEAADHFAPIRAAGVTCLAIESMAYEDYLAKVSEAAVGLQPAVANSIFSQGKSFGKILAYLSGEVAVVAANAVDHPVFFESWRNGVVADEVVEDWVEAIVKLLKDRTLRADIARAGYEDYCKRLTSEVFARRLDPILREAAKSKPKKR